MLNFFKSTIVFAMFALGTQSGLWANEFLSTKQKGGVDFAFTDLTIVEPDDGVAFSLTTVDGMSLEVRYKFENKIQSIFNGEIEPKTTFELPGNNQNIYLEEIGIHTFTFELGNGVVYSRSIIVDEKTSSKSDNQLFNPLPSRATKQLATRYKLKTETAHYQLTKPIVPEVTRASGSEIFRASSPAVVLVVAQDGIGTGSLLAPHIILTNWHVVGSEEAVNIVLKPAGFQKISLDQALIADVVKVDKRRDLALLYLRKPQNDITPIELQTEVFGIADDVHAIGHPKNNYWTYTKGVISQFRPDYEWVTDMGFVHKADVIQTQTPINPGNSGGPLFSSLGKMVGVNSFGDPDGDGLNYAVAISTVMEFIETATSSKGAPKTSNSVSTEGVPIDFDEDGYKETLAIDRNQNGVFDEFLIDHDKDGRHEKILVDENENQIFELSILTKEIDGDQLAIVRFDQDEDGIIELIGYDFDMDGEIDKYEKA